jgi:peptidoglycan/xylan/chitin deacetylase (PgdA/CDA1 family)
MLRVDRLATLFFSFPLSRVLGRKLKNRLPILMYHSISDNLFGMSHPYYHINTSPEIFSQQMRWLRFAGYRTLSLAEAWQDLETGCDMSKTVVITFDDGYGDFYTDGFEVMKQCGFTATIFLATDRIQNVPVRIEGADYLTWSQVRELHEAGISFGSHTVTHADLRSLSPEQIEYELGRSKEIIEQNLSAPVDSVSYPFAFPEEDEPFARFLEDLMENLGYDVGVSTILGRANCSSHRFFLPRLPVNTWDDHEFLHAKLEGGYDWLHWPQLIKKSIFHNTVSMQRAARIQAFSK